MNAITASPRALAAAEKRSTFSPADTWRTAPRAPPAEPKRTRRLETAPAPWLTTMMRDCRIRQHARHAEACRRADARAERWLACAPARDRDVEGRTIPTPAGIAKPTLNATIVSPAPVASTDGERATFVTSLDSVCGGPQASGARPRMRRAWRRTAAAMAARASDSRVHGARTLSVARWLRPPRATPTIRASLFVMHMNLHLRVASAFTLAAALGCAAAAPVQATVSPSRLVSGPGLPRRRLLDRA